MENYATFAVPAEAVFTRLANPFHLGDWLPQIVRVNIGRQSMLELDSAFTVTVRTAGSDLHLDAEIAAHQPPWLIAYRLMAIDPLLIRATCTATANGTRVYVQQTERTTPLRVDLNRLQQALTGTAERHCP